jgi:fructose-1,6-bisphosphatase/inositol monophosphatase family enzyme
MDKNKTYELFDNMISEAEKELHNSTVNSRLSVRKKADSTFVTQCDLAIDEKLNDIATKSGFRIISEENTHAIETVKSGNYMTIDPIDGTLGYIEYVERAFSGNDIGSFLSSDLGPQSDFCLLLGIVSEGNPAYGAVYNYVTREKILLDGSDAANTVRTGKIRNFSQKNAAYIDTRPISDSVMDTVMAQPDTSLISEAAFGLRAVYSLINPHESSIAIHRTQTAGVWDIIPAAVAARAYGGKIFDDTGEPFKTTEYVILPGHGATVIRGMKFEFITGELKKHPWIV